MLFPSLYEEDETHKEKSLNLDFPFKTKDTSKRYNNNQQNSMKEDSIIFVENVNIEISINEENKKKEELKLSLEHLYDGFLEQYSKKNYFDLVTEIETKEELFYKNSIESFKIYIIKIKSIIKLMINDFYKAICKDNNSGDNIAKEYINRIINEFKKIDKIINKNSKYENEIITQVYCNFLIFIILYEIRKENILKSGAYITLGINMMKIYFIKDIIATDVKTYFIYMKLILLFINHLINDSNFRGSLYYINLGFIILDKIFRFITINKLPTKYYKKALDYSSFNYIYCGICLEQNSMNLRLSLDCFKQANYIMEKSNSMSNYSPFSTIFKNRTNKLKYENIFYLVSSATIKLIKNKFKKIKEEQEMSMNKTIEQREKEKILNQNINEKKEQLKLVSNGLSVNFKKFFPVQEKIYKSILTPKIQVDIEKTDKELAEFVYNKKSNNNGKKKTISNEIKQNLCRFQIYNELISDNYREFIIKNDKLNFNAPSEVRENLKKIRKFLNAKNDSKNNNKEKNKLKFNTIQKKQKSRNLTLNYLNFNKTNKGSKEKSKTIFIDGREYKIPNIFKSTNSYSNYNNKSSSRNIKFINDKKGENENKSYSRNKININLKIKNNLKSKSVNSFSNKNKIFNIKRFNYSSKMKLIKNANVNTNINGRNNCKMNKISKSKSKQYHSYDLKLDNNFDREYLNKYLTTRKYQEKYFDYEKLMKKELKFQKIFLNIKSYNSKLYFDDYQKELTNYNNDINERNYMSKENAYKTFLSINNKVSDEIFGNKADLQKILNEHKRKITNITKGFKLLGKSIFDDEKMKNSWNKVIQRYILENRAKKMGKFNNYIDNDAIKKKNEKQIMKLNDSIKEIACKFNIKKKKYINSN